jgi:hypothetical protein
MDKNKGCQISLEATYQNRKYIPNEDEKGFVYTK